MVPWDGEATAEKLRQTPIQSKEGKPAGKIPSLIYGIFKLAVTRVPVFRFTHLCMNPAQRLLLVCLLIGGPFSFSTRTLGLAASVTLGDLTATYDGTAKMPKAVTDPAGLDVTWRFVDPAADPPQEVTETVFRNIPSRLGYSYNSLGFAALRTWEMGDYVQLAGTARNLESVDVVMVTWAKAATYPVYAAADPTGWWHPITLKIFDRFANGELNPIAEVTHNIFVPWRPLFLPDGRVWDTYFKGCAFLAHFDFPSGLVLPERPVITIAFNTQNSGFNRILTAGPYNELNVALPAPRPATESTYAGSDMSLDNIVQVKEDPLKPGFPKYYYPQATDGDPMFTVKANRIPEPGMTEPPVNAGTWEVTATIQDAIYQGTATGTLVIGKANAPITLKGLTAIYDGGAKTVTTTTDPAGLTSTVTYGGSLEPPSAIGKYAVHAEIQHVNYQGSIDGEMWLGNTLTSWINPWVENGSINAVGPEDDPDHDSIHNLLEYALALNPSSANPELPGGGIPRVECANGQLALIYRKNLTATDLEFQVETATQLGEPDAWSPAATVDTIVGTESTVQTIRAALSINSAESRRFARLRVIRR